MDPDTLISMHQHRNEEIISWVPAGVMRHDDRQDNKLVTDSEHLMVMGAGSGFWHEERTLADDPPLRMLQIFVRPHTLDLQPQIQHEPIPDPVTNEWRHLFGPEESAAPLSVRNDVHCYDIRLDTDTGVDLPTRPGWDTYFYVFDGEVTADDIHFDTTESGLFVGDDSPLVTALTDSVVIAFCINPDAPVTRQGTIGR
jgi:redox-sensitive bicupin YhaK (pirin superfamily)